VAKTVNGTTTWFVYDGDRVVLDVSGAIPHPWLAEYAYNGSSDLFGMRTPSWTAVAINDPTIHTVLGLARADSGAEIKRYGVLNTPWSQQTADTGTIVRFRMGGQEYDQETGLYHLGARYYDPQMGRFLSEDPAGIAGGLNLYAYAGNDPINAADPSGLMVSYAPPLGEPAGNGGENPCAMDPFSNSCWGSWLGGGGGDVDAQVWAGFGSFNLLTMAEQNDYYEEYVAAATVREAAIAAGDFNVYDMKPLSYHEFENAFNFGIDRISNFTLLTSVAAYLAGGNVFAGDQFVRVYGQATGYAVTIRGQDRPFSVFEHFTLTDPAWLRSGCTANALVHEFGHAIGMDHPSTFAFADAFTPAKSRSCGAGD
jgi:RHS repeat-associated protein